MDQRPKVGVAVIVIRNNKILLGKRRGSHGEDTWAFPGGHLEFGEGLEDCAKREVEEEAGVRIQNIRLGTFTNDIMRDEGKHYITLYLIADYDSGEPEVIEPEKCEKWDWFEWGKLPKPLFIPLENLLKQGYNPFK